MWFGSRLSSPKAYKPRQNRLGGWKEPHHDQAAGESLPRQSSQKICRTISGSSFSGSLLTECAGTRPSPIRQARWSVWRPRLSRSAGPARPRSWHSTSFEITPNLELPAALHSASRPRPAPRAPGFPGLESEAGPPRSRFQAGPSTATNLLSAHRPRMARGRIS